MPSDATETARRLTALAKQGPPPPEQEHLPCPRCDSTNTKFCYYNNYNFSQPRHFCKSCRRYWTHGGTLRDIPVGGGTRKNAKRSRTATTPPSSSPTTMVCPITAATSASVCGGVGDHNFPLPVTPVLAPASVQLDVSKGGSGGGVYGSFTSLLNTNGPGFWAFGGFGLGLGPGSGHGLEDVGFGLGRGVWQEAAGGGGAGVGVNAGAAAGMGNMWHFESPDIGFVGGGSGDCFSWPDLAISTPGNGLKR